MPPDYGKPCLGCIMAAVSREHYLLRACAAFQTLLDIFNRFFLTFRFHAAAVSSKMWCFVVLQISLLIFFGMYNIFVSGTYPDPQSSSLSKHLLARYLDALV